MYVKSNGWEIVPDRLTPNEFTARTPVDRALERGYRVGSKPVIEPRSGKGDADTAHHARNFLDCVRSREKCACDIETGHRSTSATLIANIAHKTRSYLEWDARREQFTNSSAANKLLSYSYRAPYRFPS
jgi:hypothetical protein